MTTLYEDKIKALSEWYEDFILKNRLLITIDGSDNLQNLFLESSVVSFYMAKTDKHSLVLTNEIFGLFQIEFSLDGFGQDNRKTSLRPFLAFKEIFNDYLEVNFNSTFNRPNPFAFIEFDSSDFPIVQKLFESNFHNITLLIEEANHAKVEVIESKMHEFMRNTSFSTLVKNKRGKLVFSFDDGSLINSTDDIYKKYRKELELDFFNKHSAALAKTKQIKREMDDNEIKRAKVIPINPLKKIGDDIWT